MMMVQFHSNDRMVELSSKGNVVVVQDDANERRTSVGGDFLIWILYIDGCRTQKPL